MSYLSEFEEALFDSVLLTTELTENNIIFLYQGITEPSGDYLGIYIKKINSIGQPYQSTLTDNGLELTIRNEYEARVQFIFTGTNSGSLCTEFVHNLSHVKYWQEWGNNNISIRRQGDIQSIPEKRDTKWLSRHSVELFLGFASESKEVMDVIEHVTFSCPHGTTVL